MHRFIHDLRVERPPANESAADARERLREKFPRNALRRMTHLGMLVGSALDGMDLRPDDALVYASTFSETRALEDFLASFPMPSPLLFQTSIHPGAVQQVMIGRQQPIGRVWPVAGGARVVEQALLTALLEPAPRLMLTGGEERGTWLLEHGMASDRTFAFAMVLSPERAGAVGVVEFVPATANEPSPATGGRSDDQTCPSLASFADALADRRPLAWRGSTGAWKLAWT